MSGTENITSHRISQALKDKRRIFSPTQIPASKGYLCGGGGAVSEGINWGTGKGP